MVLSLLLSDAYKFAMAEAGFPLREETFYYAHRKGGWAYMPVDIGAEVKKWTPEVTPEALAYLAERGFPLSVGAVTAYKGSVVTRAIPKGSWFYDREPVCALRGPSALTSWFEPLLLQINFRIQVATQFMLHGTSPERATCEAEADIVEEVTGRRPVVDTEGFVEGLRARVMECIAAVDGDTRRLFEVGMRAATCQDHHLLALSVLKDLGILRTSNVAAAHRLDMDPVGTMGHEHIMRFGSSRGAFAAMHDRLPGFLSYLPDTFNTVREGLPAAVPHLRDRFGGFRYDTETGLAGIYCAVTAQFQEMRLFPRQLLEGGWNAAKIRQFEKLRTAMDWPADLQGYGLGEHFVRPPWPSPSRNDVGAVYKLSWSSGPTRKYGDDPSGAKASLAGEPVLWRGRLGQNGYDGPVGWVVQEGETWTPPNAVPLTGDEIDRSVRFSAAEIRSFGAVRPLALSPETQALQEQCDRNRERVLREAT